MKVIVGNYLLVIREKIWLSVSIRIFMSYQVCAVRFVREIAALVSFFFDCQKFGQVCFSRRAQICRLLRIPQRRSQDG